MDFLPALREKGGAERTIQSLYFGRIQFLIVNFSTFFVLMGKLLCPFVRIDFQYINNNSKKYAYNS